MKNLFLLDGTTGPVKDDIIKCIDAQSPQDCTFVKKYTTRDIRSYEMTLPMDLIHQNKEDFEHANYNFSYKYSGALYGFNYNQINDALDESDNVFIVIRNPRISKKIRNDYSYVNVVTVLLYADRDGLKERLKQENFNEEEINTAVQHNDSTFAGYRANPASYDEIIITNCSPGNMQLFFDKLIGKFEGEPQLQRNLIFVVMSFDPTQSKLDTYYAAMQRAVNKFGNGKWVCRSLKDFPVGTNIFDSVMNNIASCRFVIADLTQNRPNVFYELGYAHGLKKVCVITMEKGTERYYYSSQFRNIVYDDAQDLETKLYRELQLLQNDRCIK